ncbi:prephenate dehydrogenase/arogenate dehydrogenase family protein [Chlorobium sp. N1]|uniref:prephenate dehydrogenase n=1 Tax=Chlorobium sp. N1 TaxID=2491138 RepID=UPI00103F5D9C|nr:prephenate dehydrogenase/arogenate dehydrogenase family protein [Chlorobium sp. N1]TCD48123.1 prephenate dehydrogenase/arogenate dehydrogenase family protein [Chlorobium sp. N1]
MSGKAPIGSIAFIGLGLIGMSLLRAMKNAAASRELPIVFSGFDPGFSPADREEALRLGLDCFSENRRELFGTDLVVLAAPVEANISMLDEIARLAPPTTLVTDVSSTKGLISEKARRLGVRFIGMHPMAGKEQQGFRESSADLFRDQPMILCDSRGELETERGRLLTALLRDAGCRLSRMEPGLHDRVVAKVSHLPQLLSTLLMARSGGELRHSGPGFASFTRLAGSPWEIWRDIIATNSGNISQELEGFSQELMELSRELRQGRHDTLETRFNEANRLYGELKEMQRQ